MYLAVKLIFFRGARESRHESNQNSSRNLVEQVFCEIARTDFLLRNCRAPLHEYQTAKACSGDSASRNRLCRLELDRLIAGVLRASDSAGKRTLLRPIRMGMVGRLFEGIYA